MVKLLIIYGISFLLLGGILTGIDSWGLGPLPGDVYFLATDLKVYLPFTTAFVVTGSVGFVLWAFRKI